MKEKVIPGFQKNEEIQSSWKTTYYYDLDGTLSNLNNTFAFIEGYLRSNKKFVRFFIASNLLRALVITHTYNPYKHRKFIILVYFRGLKKKDLENYYNKHYKHAFLRSLTLLGKELYENPTSADVMLTGCTEIPAKLIASIFPFKEVISTEFLYKNGKIRGINSDTHGSNKRMFVSKREKEKAIYYTDDLNSEKSLINFMDIIIEV